MKKLSYFEERFVQFYISRPGCPVLVEWGNEKPRIEWDSLVDKDVIIVGESWLKNNLPHRDKFVEDDIY